MPNGGSISISVESRTMEDGRLSRASSRTVTSASAKMFGSVSLVAQTIVSPALIPVMTIAFSSAVSCV